MHLQRGQNAEDRLRARTKRRDSLDTRFTAATYLTVDSGNLKLDLKILFIIFKVINHQTPNYISELLSFVGAKS